MKVLFCALLAISALSGCISSSDPSPPAERHHRGGAALQQVHHRGRASELRNDGRMLGWKQATLLIGTRELVLEVPHLRP